MKDFMKTLTIISVSFLGGYLYAEYKSGREFKLDNDIFSFELKSNNEFVDDIEDAISSLKNN